MTTTRRHSIELTQFDRDLLKVSPECLAAYLSLTYTTQGWVRQHYNLGHSIPRCVNDASHGLYADGFD